MKFWGDIGDVVYFKSGPNRGKKRDRIKWKVLEINMDPLNCHWAKGGTVPQYIKLGANVRGVDTTVWTCENQLDNVGVNP